MARVFFQYTQPPFNPQAPPASPKGYFKFEWDEKLGRYKQTYSDTPVIDFKIIWPGDMREDNLLDNIPDTIEGCNVELDIIKGRVPTPKDYIVSKARARLLMKRLKELGV